MSNSPVEIKNVSDSVIVTGQVGGSIITGHQPRPDISINLAELAVQLVQLRESMGPLAKSGEEFRSIAAVADAEKAAHADRSDKVTVFEYLKAAGQWALDVAMKIGVPVAVEALKKSLGKP